MPDITTIPHADLLNVTGGADDAPTGDAPSGGSPPSSFGDSAANGLGSLFGKIGSEWTRTKESFGDMKQTFGQGILRSMGLGR